MRRTVGALLLLVAVLLAACSPSDEGATAATGLPLEGTPWTLLSYDDGGSLTDVDQGVEATALFEEGQVSGSGGCNRFTAGYTREGDALTIDPAATTLMACPEPASSVEAAVLAALDRTASFATDEATLTLSDADGTTLLVFAETGP